MFFSGISFGLGWVSSSKMSRAGFCSHSRSRDKLQTVETSFFVSVETQVLDCWDLVFGLSWDSSSRLSRLCSHSGSCSRLRLKLQTVETSFLVSVETQVLDCWDLVFGLSRDSSSRLSRLCSHSGSCSCLRLKSQTVKTLFLVSVETQVPDCQDLVLILDLVLGQDSSSRLSRPPCLKIIWKRETFFSLPVFWTESSVATSCVSKNKFFVFSC
jgi:hypothetical protein